ncbi:putative terpene synthase 13 [Silene latifolia]|uniref:putative terpene synthase 13 n=1 Tax=Silene latifolia TaxID=37657 RepID=UPI003D781E59
MTIISSLKLPIFPKETKIYRMSLTRESGFKTRHTAETIYPSKNKNIILKKGTRINIMSTVQQSSVEDETLVTVEPVEVYSSTILLLSCFLYFIESYSFFIFQQNHQLQKKVQRIKEMILSKTLKSYHVEDLVMIDAIQRLGLQYYFQNEIGRALRRQYERWCTEEGNRDLHDTALAFHLLRQHGYNVSADCFSKFKDNDGNFKQELEMDSKGLMSLYEAFQMRVPGDHTLDNTGEFSAQLLRKIKNTEPSKSFIIENTLTNPYHKTLPRFTAMDFLQNFQSSIKSLHNFK